MKMRNWDWTKIILFLIGIGLIVSGIVLATTMKLPIETGVMLSSGTFAGLLAFSRNGTKKNAQNNKEALLTIKEIKLDCQETKNYVRENRKRITAIETHLLTEKSNEYQRRNERGNHANKKGK